MREPQSPGPGCSRSQSRERTVVLTCFKSPSTSPRLGQGRSPWPLLASGLRLPAVHQAPQRWASKSKTLLVLLSPSVQSPHCLPVKPEVWIPPLAISLPCVLLHQPRCWPSAHSSYWHGCRSMGSTQSPFLSCGCTQY